MNHIKEIIRLALIGLITMIIVAGLFVVDQSRAATSRGPESLLFSDDFSGDLSQWPEADRIGNWSINQGQLLGTGWGYGTDGWIYAGDYEWEDYVLQADVHFVNPNAMLVVRSTGHWFNEYRIDIWQEGGENSNAYNITKYFYGNSYTLVSGTSPVPITNPSIVQVMVDGNHFYLFINGALVDEVEDLTPLPNGRIGLGVIWYYSTRFDNVSVTTLPPILLLPFGQEAYGRPGNTVTYEVELENHTGATDSFNLSVLPGNAWTTNLSTLQLGPIEDGESAEFTVSVDIPPDALPLASDMATIQAASVASPENTATATVNTSVLGEETAYVTLEDSHKVAMVDVTTQVVYDSIDTTQYGCNNPWRASMTPGGDFVYVSCFGSGSVMVIETESNDVVANITDIPWADDVAFIADGAHALVGSRHYSQVAVVDTSTYTIEQFISTNGITRSVAVHPYMPRAYITCGSGDILVMDTTTFGIIQTIHIGGNPWDVAVTPNGMWVLAGDRNGSGLFVIDANTNAVSTAITGFGEVTGLEVSADSGLIFAGGLWNEVWVIDGNSFSVITSIWIDGVGWELALTGDGTQLYVGNVSSQVAVIDAVNFTVTGYIPMPGSPSRGIAITPQYVAEGIFLFPPFQAKDGGRGDAVAYNLTLFNNSGDTETFDLSVSGNTWQTQLSTYQVGPVPDGESVTFIANVTVPADEPWYNTDTATILATGVGDPTLTSEALVTTTAFAHPQISVNPDHLSSTQDVGEITTQNLTISNGEGVELTYDIFEGTYPGNVAALHLDEPAGSTSFADVSGYGNNAACTGDECPLAGEPGVVGTALRFDGVNDNIQIPHNAAFDLIEDQDRVSMAAWVNVNQWWGDGFPIMNQNGEDWWRGWEFGIHTYDIYFVASHYNSGISCSFYFNTNQWYHVAVAYDRSAGTIQFYVNGTQICNLNYDYDIVDTANTPMYIGESATDYDEYDNGLIDEVYIFDRALTTDEIATLYQGSLSGDVPWLLVDPMSGSVPTNGSDLVEVTFDSTGIQPGDYETELFISNNDPLQPMLTVPVNLSVEPTAVMGQVAGTVTDAWSGDPIAAQVELEGVYIANADPDYSIWAGEGSYSISAYAAGYYTVTLPVEIVAGEITDQDIGLEPALPKLGELPAEINFSVPEGSSDTQALELFNDGPMPLDIAFFEMDPLRSLDGVDSLTGKSILYDMAHGQGDLSSYSTLAGDLIAAGATIDGNYEPFNDTTLEGYDILWINGGGGTWTYPELQIVDQWLADGGTVLIQGDNSPAVFAPASIFGVEYVSEGCYWGTTTIILPHPITEGVNEVYFDWICSHLNNTGEILVEYWDLQPHMVAAVQGRGKMVVVAGSDFSNGPIGNSDNRLLAMNTFLWLAVPVYGDVPWLSETPEAGTIPGHGSDTTTLTFDATSLTVGGYDGFLAVEHSDVSQDSPILIPVHLTVTVPEPPTYNLYLPTVISGQSTEAIMTLQSETGGLSGRMLVVHGLLDHRK